MLEEIIEVIFNRAPLSVLVLSFVLYVGYRHHDKQEKAWTARLDELESAHVEILQLLRQIEDSMATLADHCSTEERREQRALMNRLEDVIKRYE